MVWTEIGDIVHRASTQTMGWTLNTMTVLPEAGGSVCEGCCVAVVEG